MMHMHFCVATEVSAETPSPLDPATAAAASCVPSTSTPPHPPQQLTMDLSETENTIQPATSPQSDDSATIE